MNTHLLEKWKGRKGALPYYREGNRRKRPPPLGLREQKERLAPETKNLEEGPWGAGLGPPRREHCPVSGAALEVQRTPRRWGAGVLSKGGPRLRIRNRVKKAGGLLLRHRDLLAHGACLLDLRLHKASSKGLQKASSLKMAFLKWAAWCCWNLRWVWVVHEMHLGVHSHGIK